MKKERTFTAKTVEEALSMASVELGKPEEKLQYEIVEQAKKGFLGLGGSEAKIVVKYEAGVRETTEEFLQTFIKNTGLNATLRCEEKSDGELLYSIEGSGLGVLIVRHGEALESLQYLLSLVSNRHDDNFIRVSLDIENYRSKREETLKNLAGRTAARVKKSGRNVTFEPMSAHERRIIHSQAQDIPGVTTYSIGSGSDRRVVMALAGRAPNAQNASPGREFAPPRREQSGAQSQAREARPQREEDPNKPKVTYEYNPVREPKKVVKAKSIEDINLADVEDTEMVNL